MHYLARAKFNKKETYKRQNNRFFRRKVHFFNIPFYLSMDFLVFSILSLFTTTKKAP